ncbi:Sulfite oxidase [Nitrospira tepida]|uniref:Sulfite oxidase n=1 Tax=Nitrospira tepida TaxID=2973512 RepID=A0AA86MWL9_9BACT|nr:sulfite oxidase [Nitrospira tepida]CAI4030332.1 Sulfite oxidase [Nitrospira tepida]
MTDLDVRTKEHDEGGKKLREGQPRSVSRREFLVQGSSTLALLAVMNSPLLARFAQAEEGTQLIPFLDRPPAPPEQAIKAYGELNKHDWQRSTSWITPAKDFFTVSHYNRPQIREEDWRLTIGGLVERPVTFSLDQLRALPRQEVVFTLECAGNHGFDWFTGGIGTAKWTGTPLAPILKQAGIKHRAVDVVFFGADEGEEEVREIKMRQCFSRSLSVPEALDPSVLLCYEMNGEPLPHLNGYPARLIVPGWYGVANVKWLTRIEVIDRRWAGRFMSKDYVTIREEKGSNGETVWTQKTVGRSLIKSAPARVIVRNGKYRIEGVAWGAPVQRVEVQIDDGPWLPATIDRGQDHDYAWKFWHLDWEARSGEHRVTSRAVDREGNVQPALTDPVIANKRTYWESNGQITRRVRIA